MLTNLATSARWSKIGLANMALALAALMCAFPFLQYRHQNPLTSFDQEWWSAMLGLLSLCLMFAKDLGRQSDIPRIVQLPLALVVVALLHLALGKIAYFSQALLYISYLLFAALMMLLGARLRDFFGVEKLAAVLAYALLTGAEISAFIGLLQHYQLHTPLDAVIVMQVSASVYGNLAQPNHFADYIALGLISLGLLFQLRKVKPVYTVLLAVPLLFALTLSGSRASWLYVTLMVLLAWLQMRRNAAMKPLVAYTAVLLVVFALMNLSVHMLFATGADTGTDTLKRLIGDNAEGHANELVRLYLWKEAWLIFLQSPWIGVGFGQFGWHHFELLPTLRGPGITGLYNNTHNLISQLGAESGLVGLLALLGSLAAWVYALRRAAQSPAHWWGLAALGVLGIHSLVEYPLWYAYFLAIAALLLGMLDETRYRMAVPGIWRISVGGMLVLGFVSLMHLRSDFLRLIDTSVLAEDGNEASQHIRENLLAIQGGSLLSPYSEMLILSVAEVNPEHIRQKIALGNNVMHFAPIASVVYRQAFLLAQDGQLSAAERLMEQAVWSFPDNREAHQQLLSLAEKDPVHFSALLEFTYQKEQERASAVHKQ